MFRQLYTSVGKRCCCLVVSRIHLGRMSMSSRGRRPSWLDTSRVPEIVDDDLEEQFVRGTGPGGQNVNKRSTCVVLRHIPTDTLVRCHQKRTQEENRVIARQMLRDKLDDQLNGELSVSAQLRRRDEEKSRKHEQHSRKLNELKKAFLEREKADSGNVKS